MADENKGAFIKNDDQESFRRSMSMNYRSHASNPLSAKRIGEITDNVTLKDLGAHTVFRGFGQPIVDPTIGGAEHIMKKKSASTKPMKGKKRRTVAVRAAYEST